MNWKLIEHRHTGDTVGLLCGKCEPSYPFKEELLTMERIEDNLQQSCSLCGKEVREDYCICGECGGAYPR